MDGNSRCRLGRRCDQARPLSPFLKCSKSTDVEGSPAADAHLWVPLSTGHISLDSGHAIALLVNPLCDRTDTPERVAQAVSLPLRRRPLTDGAD